jgi:hypothetical protein
MTEENLEMLGLAAICLIRSEENCVLFGSLPNLESGRLKSLVSPLASRRQMA